MNELDEVHEDGLSDADMVRWVWPAVAKELREFGVRPDLVDAIERAANGVGTDGHDLLSYGQAIAEAVSAPLAAACAHECLVGGDARREALSRKLFQLLAFHQPGPSLEIH